MNGGRSVRLLSARSRSSSLCQECSTPLTVHEHSKTESPVQLRGVHPPPGSNLPQIAPTYPLSSIPLSSPFLSLFLSFSNLHSFPYPQKIQSKVLRERRPQTHFYEFLGSQNASRGNIFRRLCFTKIAVFC